MLRGALVLVLLLAEACTGDLDRMFSLVVSSGMEVLVTEDSKRLLARLSSSSSTALACGRCLLW